MATQVAVAILQRMWKNEAEERKNVAFRCCIVLQISEPRNKQSGDEALTRKRLRLRPMSRLRRWRSGDTMASVLFTLAEVESALPIVRSAVPPTPQYAWPQLAARTGAEVFVKHENHTPIGAFKVRGGVVYMDRLRRERPQAA